MNRPDSSDKLSPMGDRPGRRLTTMTADARQAQEPRLSDGTIVLCRALVATGKPLRDQRIAEAARQPLSYERDHSTEPRDEAQDQE